LRNLWKAIKNCLLLKNKNWFISNSTTRAGGSRCG